MSNSKLVDYIEISPNQSGKRNHKIDRITPHCVVGQISVQALGAWFAKKTAQASSNYGIGRDGSVGMYVSESDRSWCSSSPENDNRSVTIECASDAKAPYAFNSNVYHTLVNLCVDICKRNDKKKLIWFNSKSKSLSYDPKPDEMVLTAHRWFANTQCPGEWMYNRMDDLADQVTKRLNKKKSFVIQVGAYAKKSNANNMLAKVKKAGYKNAIIVHDDKLYYVRITSGTKKKANVIIDDLHEKGFSAILT